MLFSSTLLLSSPPSPSATSASLGCSGSATWWQPPDGGQQGADQDDVADDEQEQGTCDDKESVTEAVDSVVIADVVVGVPAEPQRAPRKSSVGEFFTLVLKQLRMHYHPGYGLQHQVQCHGKFHYGFCLKKMICKINRSQGRMHLSCVLQ